MDEAHRRHLADALLAQVRRRRDNWWSGREATALAVAAVGCLPTAARVADMLGRRSVSLWAADASPVIVVARQRRVSWLPELAHRLAERLGRTNPEEGWWFIADLVTAEKARPPTGDRFVEGWLSALAWPPEYLRPIPLVDRLRADAFLDALVPRLVEVDGAGSRMTFSEFMTDEKWALPRALVRLAEEGLLDRVALLDGCLSRLLRGDRPAALRAFVSLHELLAPTPDERASRSSDYLRLLADGPAPVASMAQKAMRNLPDIEVATIVDVSQSVLTRPDKALVRAQLSWLDQLARRVPDRASEIGAVLAVALDHPAADIRDRAGRLASRHGYAAPPAAVMSVTGDDLSPPPAALPAPPPITDPDELAEEVAALLSTTMTALPLERVLDALVRLAGGNQPRLGQAVTPVLQRHRAGMGDHSWDPCCLCGILTGVLHAAGDPVQGWARQGRWTALLAPFRRRQTPTADPRVPPPHRLLRMRLAEIGKNVGPPHPGLLAAPTTTTGAVDPMALYERIACLGDRSPWPWDLHQALLRLPPDVDEPLATKAAALRTPAGDQLAARLRTGGVPRPLYQVIDVPRRERRQPYDWEYDHLPQQRTLVTASPSGTVDDPLGLLTAPPAPLNVSYGHWALLWPTVLPWHRGLVACYALPEVASTADQDARGGAAILPLLALAYGLGARHEADRIATLDALLMLAATGDLNTTAVGAHLGALAANGSLTLTRTVQPLRDAATAGAPLTTVRILAAALPVLLASPTPPRGTPDLLTLAAETATTTGLRTNIPGLAETAARSGSSRLITEARRLIRAVGGRTAAV